MRKLTALFVASTLALGAANLAHAADTTTAAPADAKPMMHHNGKFAPHHDERKHTPSPKDHARLTLAATLPIRPHSIPSNRDGPSRQARPPP